MPQPTTPSEQLAALIPDIHQFAQFVVAEILAYQPDLLIGLAHSGWLPVLAAQVVWETQQDAPFPPTLRLNFGQEKLDPHVTLWGQTDHNELGLDRAPTPFLAHVLYWAGEQAQWREELVELVTAVLGPHHTPQRILVVDEGIMDATTYWPLMGLLTAVYPQADILFSPGCFLHWGNKATAAWLEQHAPDVMPQLEAARAQLAEFGPERRQLHDALRWVAAGTEDDDPHSLHCAPVGEDGQSVRLLSAYMPVAQWLRIAPWAHTFILHAIQQLALTQSDPLSPKRRWSFQFNQRTGLPADITLMRLMWQKGSFTRRDVAAWGNFSPAKASRKLRSLYYDASIAALGWGGGTRYALDPVYCPKFAETYGGPNNNAYWIVPDRLLVGPHPLTAEGFCDSVQQGLVWLQTQGVTFLLDIAGPIDLPWQHGGDMAAHLQAYAAEHQYAFNYQQIPWSPHKTPTPDQLHQTLHTLESAQMAGHAVYLYSYRGTGRAALAAAAHLVGQGRSPCDAWRFLCQQWAQTVWGPYRRLPDTEGQRRFLLSLEEWL
ncbi:MAG: hypothetical protein R6X34_19630 [Chloroflexota bacterium]